MYLPEPERTLALPSAATGLRISESLGLQWGDVDIENRKITVRTQSMPAERIAAQGSMLNAIFA
jgi:integrase